MRPWFALLLVVSFATMVSCKSDTKVAAGASGLAVFAGVPSGVGSADGSSSAALFNNPLGVAVDGASNVYVADAYNHTIRKIGPTGAVSTLAGSAGWPGSEDGPGASAQFDEPSGVAVDGTGNVFVADHWNNTVRKITPDGMVSTLAGTAGGFSSVDGTGASAGFHSTIALAIDGAGNLFVVDDDTVRKITQAGVVTTLADSKGATIEFSPARGVAVDDGNNLFVTNGNVIQRISPAGVVSTLAGTVGSAGSADGTGAAARFNSPQGLAVDRAGDVFVADTGNHTVRKITPAGEVTTLAGSPGAEGGVDGTGASARFRQPATVAVDGTGNVLVADSGNNAIRKITADGVVTTLAGTMRSLGSADGAGAAARFYWPIQATVDSSGNLFVADSGNHTIRKITPAGEVSTLAGSAGHPGSTNGTGDAARFNDPRGVGVDGAGNLYVADAGNSTIRKITPAGAVATFAGTAGYAGSRDGTSASAFDRPCAVAVDGVGNVFVADMDSNTIRKITPAGVVSTLAGLAFEAGRDDGSGSAARFDRPGGLALDGTGNLYVADTGSGTIRKITPAGVVSTLAGTARLPGGVDGQGSAALLRSPLGLAVDGAGNVYVADVYNNSIRRITDSGMVTTVVGVTAPRILGTMPGSLPASLASPAGVAMDLSRDRLYITVADAVLVAPIPN